MAFKEANKFNKFHQKEGCIHPVSEPPIGDWEVCRDHLMQVFVFPTPNDDMVGGCWWCLAMFSGTWGINHICNS